ncbi:GT4 family glycosyltransferase PelF [Fictibacillus nanhaiensis]|uniref:GT4 family glycosyltransferase PelF n=1 Tax=Fictibacillus nanhaiensis TaxID=742169 RepID=UPI001FE24848|nr:GT4 family glycosyltransferase PelF [Fictibacillus nanhaiensis]
MKVGLIAEGSYPFVSGGVSSWAHLLTSQLHGFSFGMYTITSEQKVVSDIEYDLPWNFDFLKNLPISVSETSSFERKPNLTKQEVEHLFEWFTFQSVDPNTLLLIGDQTRMGNLKGFFQSPEFYEIVQRAYQYEEQSGSFLDYVYTYKSMYTPVIQLLQQSTGSDVDLYHSFSTGYGGLLGAYLSVKRNKPFVITEHGIYSREREEEILRAGWVPLEYKKRWIQFFHHLSRQAYTVARDIVSLFENNRLYQIELGAPIKKTNIIPNGITIPETTVTTESSQTMFTIGSIVRVVPIKDIKTMIYTAKILQSQGEKFQWEILGPDKEDPEYADACLKLVAELGLSSVVHFKGLVDITQYVGKYDVCVLSSISEGQPLAVLEGMAYGKPWIVTDVGGCRELIEGREDDVFGSCGFVVPPVNPEALAERISWCIHNRDLLPELGETGRRRAVTLYSSEKVSESYERLYRKDMRYGRNRLSITKTV